MQEEIISRFSDILPVSVVVCNGKQIHAYQLSLEGTSILQTGLNLMDLYNKHVQSVKIINITLVLVLGGKFNLRSPSPFLMGYNTTDFNIINQSTIFLRYHFHCEISNVAKPYCVEVDRTDYFTPKYLNIPIICDKSRWQHNKCLFNYSKKRQRKSYVF